MKGIELTPEHPIDRIGTLGAIAEAAGFDTVLASCHYNNRDPFLALARIALETDEIRIGPAAANPYESHPAVLASRMATLDEACGGRTVLGIGPGDRSTLATLGVDRDQPLQRVLESVDVARRLWAGEQVSHDGTFRVIDAGLNYEARAIPVYVGAQGPDMLRMAAKHTDGVLFNGAHPDDIAWANHRIQEGLADRPPEYGSFDFAAYASVSIADDEAAARDAARPPVAFITGGASPPVLDRHGIDRDQSDAIGEDIATGRFDSAFDRVTERMLEAFSISGTPSQVAADVEAVLGYADSFVVGAPLGPDLDQAIKLAGEAIDRASEA